MCVKVEPLVTVNLTANSTASRPKSVVNLMTGLSATEEVSLKGSPTVSPTTVASCSGGALLLQLHFHNLLGIVPSGARIGHKDRLVEAEDGDRNQIADEEERFEEGEGQSGEEHAMKMLSMPFCAY